MVFIEQAIGWIPTFFPRAENVKVRGYKLRLAQPQEHVLRRPQICRDHYVTRNPWFSSNFVDS